MPLKSAWRSSDGILDWADNWFCMRVLCRFGFRVHFKRSPEGLVVMERGIGIMDQSLGSLANSWAGLLPRSGFFKRVNDLYLNLRILWDGQPGTSAAFKAVSVPFQGLSSFLKSENYRQESVFSQPFLFGKGAQGEDFNRHFHAPHDSKKKLDLEIDLLHNSSCGPEKKSREAATSRDQGAHLSAFNQLRSTTNMLSQSRINAPFERAVFPLTPYLVAGAASHTTPSYSPGDSSLFEACDFCDSRAVEEVVSYTGDEEHIQFLCEKCWMLGFSQEAEEVAA